MITFEHVSKSFSGAEVISDISFSVAKNEIAALTGPSGSGKTTLLRLISGTLRPDEGVVKVGSRRTAFVFQDHRLLPWHTARDNITLVLRAAGMSKAESRERAGHWLAQVGLEKYAGYYPAQLSGGMVQRVSIARAFSVEPQIVLLDEPFSSLDTELTDSLLLMLRKVLDEHQTTVVYVTHDVMEALRLADRMFTLGADGFRERVITDRQAMLKEYCASRLEAFG